MDRRIVILERRREHDASGFKITVSQSRARARLQLLWEVVIAVHVCHRSIAVFTLFLRLFMNIVKDFPLTGCLRLHRHRLKEWGRGLSTYEESALLRLGSIVALRVIGWSDE